MACLDLVIPCKIQVGLHIIPLFLKKLNEHCSYLIQTYEVDITNERINKSKSLMLTELVSWLMHRLSHLGLIRFMQLRVFKYGRNKCEYLETVIG